MGDVLYEILYQVPMDVNTIKEYGFRPTLAIIKSTKNQINSCRFDFNLLAT